MDFYNKYKQLFQVREPAPPVANRLTLNHQLFIEQPYRPAYNEQLKLSSKLMDMRKGADDLEDKIDQIMGTIKSIRHETPPPASHEEKVRTARPISTKLSNIFNTQQNQLVKQSEMEHVFNYRMKEAKRQHVDDPTPKLISPVKENAPTVKFPKLEPIKKFEQYPVNNGIFQAVDEDDAFRPGQYRQQRILTQEQSYKKAPPTKISSKQALGHRKEAARKLQDRRQKLRSLLKAR